MYSFNFECRHLTTTIFYRRINTVACIVEYILASAIAINQREIALSLLTALASSLTVQYVCAIGETKKTDILLLSKDKCFLGVRMQTFKKLETMKGSVFKAK